MLGGWKRTIQQSIRPDYVTKEGDHQGIRYGKIIFIDDITKKREINRKGLCSAVCKNGKPCVHNPKEFEIFCGRHLKVASQL